MWCTVFNCNKNNEGPHYICKSASFFTFPKNLSLVKQWILFCKRKDNFNHKTAKICSKHFVKEDFANYLKYEMGFADRLQSKPGSVPTIFHVAGENDIQDDSKRTENMNVRKNKIIICSLLEITNVGNITTEEIEVTAGVEPEDWQSKFNEMSSINYKTQQEIDELNAEMKNLKSENYCLLEAETSHNNEMDIKYK